MSHRPAEINPSALIEDEPQGIKKSAPPPSPFPPKFLPETPPVLPSDANRGSRRPKQKVLKELGNSDLPDGSGRLTNPLLAVREIQVSTEGDSSFGAVTRASFTASAMLTPVRRVRLPPTGGAGLGRGVCAVVATTTKTTTTTGQCGFGVAFWDEDEDEDEGENEGKVGGGAAAAGGSQDPEYWICPVYMVRDMKEGWPLSECLVLRKSVRVEGAFERVAKAKVTTGWLEGTVERVITVV